MNSKRILEKLVPVFAAVICFLWAAVPAYSAETVTVFAAASTTNAMTEIGTLFAEKKQGEVLPSYAASSTLAKQIENGAPAEIFLSANEKWMDYLEEKDRIVPSSRYDLLGNRIVLIAPTQSALGSVDIQPGFRLDELLNGEYLAMGDPDHVPAGMYGKQALEALGVWDRISTQVARQKDVRSALALVERGEVPLGVVYATDAAITDRVKVVGIFPEDCHPRIVYPVALVKGNETEMARRFMEFMKSGEARAVFAKYGFTAP